MTKDTKDVVHNEHSSYEPLIGAVKAVGLGLTLWVAGAGFITLCVWVYEFKDQIINAF
jgi:hypothetical protein